MECKLKNQKGYLLVAALALIVVVTFIGAVLVYLFIGKTKTTRNDYLSKVALYNSISCLENVKRKIVIGSQGCEEFTSDTTYQFCGFSDSYAGIPATASQVEGVYNAAISQLTNNIDQQNTTILLDSVAGFAESGLIVIGPDVFSYSGIDGNYLLNVRWLWGGYLNHPMGEPVAQAQCTINVTTGVPGLTDPEAKKIIKQSILAGVGFNYNGASPAMVGGSTVFMTGSSSVLNNCIMLPDDDCSSCATIVAANNVQFQGDAHTEIRNPEGVFVIGSDKNGLQSDVTENYEPIRMNGVFEYIFKVSRDNLENNINTYIPHKITDDNISELDHATGTLIWIKGDIDLNTGSATVGALSNPVILVGLVGQKPPKFRQSFNCG